MEAVRPALEVRVKPESPGVTSRPQPCGLVVCCQAMAEAGMPLLVHGEVTDPSVDIFEREAEFVHSVLRVSRRELS
jgi:dihydroorotase